MLQKHQSWKIIFAIVPVEKFKTVQFSYFVQKKTICKFTNPCLCFSASFHPSY